MIPGRGEYASKVGDTGSVTAATRKARIELLGAVPCDSHGGRQRGPHFADGEGGLQGRKDSPRTRQLARSRAGTQPV